MIVAWYSDRLGNSLVLLGTFQNRPCIQLANQGPLDFLPWRLGGGHRVAAGLHQRAPTCREFLVADQYVGRSASKIDPHAVSGVQQRKAAACGGLRGCV
jgi:hypothetical protein